MERKLCSERDLDSNPTTVYLWDPVQLISPIIGFLIHTYTLMIVRAGKSEICRAGWEHRQELLMLTLEAEFLLWETLGFALQASLDEAHPCYEGVGLILYIKSKHL